MALLLLQWGYFIAMPVFPVELCRQMVAEYSSALSAVLKSQSYSIGGRVMTKANLAEIQKGLDLWCKRRDAAESGTSSNGRPRTRSVIAHV
jgi:hypothetical protein